jgi:hypothetical protein
MMNYKTSPLWPTLIFAGVLLVGGLIYEHAALPKTATVGTVYEKTWSDGYYTTNLIYAGNNTYIPTTDYVPPSYHLWVSTPEGYKDYFNVTLESWNRIQLQNTLSVYYSKRRLSGKYVLSLE